MSPVQDIPLKRIDHDILLAPDDSVLVMPYFERARRQAAADSARLAGFPPPA